MPTLLNDSGRLRFSLRRSLSAAAAVGSLLLLATCDIDKITAVKKEGGAPTVSFNITGGTEVQLAGTTALGITPTFANTVQRWKSSAPTIAAVDNLTGVVTGLSIGTANITVRLLGMELDTGVVKTQEVRVRYKGIRVTSPSTLDTITGLGQTRAVSVFGLNAANVVQATALTAGATLSIRDSGGTGQTIASLSGTTVTALKNGAAYVKAIYDVDLRDSVKVRVRQVAKNIAFTDTVFTANAMNFNRFIPISVVDVANQPITAPVARWRSSDTNKVAIDSVTGALRVKVRDTARVTVRVDTVNRSIKVRLIQQVGSLTKSAGDAQTDTIGRLLPTALEVTALDSGGVAVPGVTVTFRLGAERSADAVITDSVKITDANGKAALGSWTLGIQAGPQTVIATVGGVSTTFTATARPAAPKKLFFSVQPTSAAVAAAIAPAVKVAIQDSAGNVVDTATSVVTLSFNTNPGSAVLNGTLSKAAVNGVATFDNLSVSAGGAGFVLKAVATGLTTAVSNSFDAFGAPTKLGFLSQPVGSTAGGIMQQVRVAVQDANGATVTTATDQVTLALGANPGSASLNGTTTQTASNGIAYFDNLSVSAAASGYTMVASATGRTSATSNAFTVQAVGQASKLAFSVQPSNAVSGVAIAPAIKVRVLDVNNALVTNSSQQITLSVQDGTALSGTVSVAAVNGEATFNNVSIAKSGTGYRLIATATGSTITSATSGTFNITPGAQTKLGFVQNPTHVVQGQTMSPAVTVAVQDANGNTVTSAPVTSVSLALVGSGCTASALGGGGATNTIAGVATFSSITVSQVLSNCALQATATGLTAGQSAAFNTVAANGPVKLAFTIEPAASTTAGVTMNAGTVNIQDSNGNNVSASSSTQLTLSVLSGPGGFAGGSTTNISTLNSATFSNVRFEKAGTYRLLVSATGYRPDTSASFTVSAAAANNLQFITQPVTGVAGVPFANAVQVAVVDQYGNVVTSATSAIQLSSSLTQSPFTSLRFNNGQFNVTANAVNGVATFTGLAIRTSTGGVGARINASGSGFFGQSNIFDVANGPLTALGFKTNPNLNVTAGQTLNSIQVQGQDSVGNAIADFSSSVTLTLIGGNPAAVLNGTKIQPPVAGVATFANLSINATGSGYQLSASASGVSTATSTAFNVNAGSAVKLGWIKQPVNTFQNAPLNPAGDLPQIAVQDALGNTVTNDNMTIRVTIVSPPGSMTLQDGQVQVTQKDIFSTNGVVTLPSNLTISEFTAPGSPIQLQAATPFRALTGATSASFNVGAYDTKTKLEFWAEPTNTTYGMVPDPMPLVVVADQYGNRDTTATNQITLSFGSNPGGATLSVTTYNPTQGYSWLWPTTINKVGAGYTIVASAAGLTSATSQSFNVTSPGLVARFSNVCDMAARGDYVFWLECGSANRLLRTPKVGGWVDTLVTGIANGQRVAVDDNNVYWIEYGASNGSGAVKKYNFNAENVTTMASGLFDVRYGANTFLIDDANAYFVARNNAGTTSAIKSVALSVGGPTTPTDLFEVTPLSTGSLPYFTVSAGNIYFLDPANDVIKRVPTTGGSPVTLTVAGQGSGVMFLQLSGTTLIFSQQSNVKTVANANTIAGPVTPTTQLASGATFYSWHLDGTNLFANDNGTLKRYLVTDFGNVVTYVSGLNLNAESIFTDDIDVFVRYNVNGNHIAKVPK